MVTLSRHLTVLAAAAGVLAQLAMVAAFNIHDVFVPVSMDMDHSLGSGGTDPLEQQAWELLLAPIDDTSLVLCTERVYGESIGSWVHAPPVYLEAVAEAVRHACSEEAPSVSAMTRMYRGSLYAMSEAVAQASLECEAVNADYQCFSLETTTTSFVSSSIQLHIEAVAAAAVRECSCDQTSVSAWAAGYATSRKFLKLEASATASIDLDVCVEGDGTFVDSGYDACTETISAEIFARATASAIASGSCSTAASGIRALTEISRRTRLWSTCDD